MQHPHTRTQNQAVISFDRKEKAAVIGLYILFAMAAVLLLLV